LLGAAAELARRGVGDVAHELRDALSGANTTALREQSHASDEQINALADALASAGADAVIVCGDRLAQAPGALAAAWNLAASTGARFAWVPRRAGMRGSLWAGVHPGLLPGGRRVDDAAARQTVEHVWGTPILPTPGKDARGILDDVGELGVLFIAGVDPAADFCDATLGQRALDGAEFLVAQDLFLTASSRKANVIFPASAFAERDGTITDWEGRQQGFAMAVPPPGVTRPDWDILSLLANEAGVAFPRTREELRKEMESLQLPETDPSPLAMPPVPMRRLDEHHPFTLLTYPMLLDAGTMMMGAIELLQTAPQPFVEIGRGDAERLGINEGDTVRVTSACGRVEAPARVTNGMADRCVFVPATQSGPRGLALLDVGEPVTLVRVEKV
jgi:NADH-quinone oxidoreductase subunit G